MKMKIRFYIHHENTYMQQKPKSFEEK